MLRKVFGPLVTAYKAVLCPKNGCRETTCNVFEVIKLMDEIAFIASYKAALLTERVCPNGGKHYSD